MPAMKQILLAGFVGAMFIACQGPKENTENSARDTVVTDTVETAPIALRAKWETDTVLTTCESVLYDKDRNVLYVANINGAPDAKDKNGFISKLSTDGKITELQWVRNLHAPKGMGLSGNKLYVADIDRVIEIDVTTGKMIKTFAVEGAKFLNDITVDTAGRIFISDMQAGNILMIENGKLSKWLDNVDGPNGLLAQDGNVMMLSWNAKTINAIDQSTKQVTVKNTGIENLDGVEAVGDGGYLVSSWNGMVQYVDKDWKNFTLLDLRSDSVNCADIEYIPEMKLLLVPTFFRNTVRAYELTQ
jgi:sugar lactone lactonase YvrE